MVKNMCAKVKDEEVPTPINLWMVVQSVLKNEKKRAQL